MVSKCANPDCSAPFHYLREGKVFRLEIQPGTAGPSPQPISAEKPVRHLEHFWLCGSCSQTMTLAVEKDKGVVAVPLRSQFRVAAAS